VSIGDSSFRLWYNPGVKIKSFGLILLFNLLALTSGLAEVSEPGALENLGIPASLGKIESRYKGTSGRWVVHIQDVHAHLTAQQNIAALLDHLNTAYGIQAAAIEGTWHQSSLPKSWGVPPSREKQMLAQALLEEDYLNGAVYAAIFSKTPIQLVGLEDEPLYWENGGLYLEHLKDRETVLEKLGVLEQKIQAAKNNTYNPDLLKFDGALSAFRSGKKAENFIPSLLELTAAKEVGLEDLPQIQTFKKALEMEKSLNQEKLKSESQRLVQAFKYSHMNFEELLQSGKVPAEKLEFYPNAKLYLGLMKVQGEIAHREFFSEIETAIERLKERLLGTTDEKTTDKRSEAFTLARKIILLQATPSEVKAFGTRQADIVVDLQEAALEEALNNGQKFYEAAQKRDQVFLDKIINDPKLQGNIAVVTGGFHTEGLTEKLEGAGISYIVVSPDLGQGEAVNETLYFERIRENLAVTHAFTDLPPAVLTEARDSGFKKAAEGLAAEKNIGRAKEVYLSFQGVAAAGLPSSVNAASALSDDALREMLEIYLDPLNAKKRIIIVIRQSVLEKLLEDPLAQKIWKETILASRQNTVVLIQDGDRAFTDTEGDAVFKTARGTIDAVAKRELSKLLGKDGQIGVIDNAYESGPGIIAVKPEPAAIALLRAILENDPRISLSNLDAIMERAAEILKDLLNARATQTSA
jgi:hypothetical protein